MYHIKIFLAFLAMGCKSYDTSQKNSSAQERIPFEVIAEGANSNLADESFIVIQDEEALYKVFAEINANKSPGVPVPEIDFTTNTILFLATGQKSTSGYHIKVAHILKGEEEIIVNYVEESPAPTDMVAMVITHPYVMVRLEKQSLPFNFKKTN